MKINDARLHFKNPYSADFLLKCRKRFRKYGGLLTGITQNISDCLLNEAAGGMFFSKIDLYKSEK